MKRLVALFLSMLILVSLCSCTNSNANDYNDVETTESAVIDEISQIEQEAINEFALIAEDIENGTYEPGFYKTRIDELAEEYPDNEVVNTYYNIKTVVFWKAKIDDMSASDENYDLFSQYYKDALAKIDITLDIEYMDSIKKYIENFIGMDFYLELHEELRDKIDSANSLTDEERIEILVYVFEKEDSYGDGLTDEKTMEIWEEACEKYNITMSELTSMFSDMELTQRAYMLIEAQLTNKPSTNTGSSTTTSTSDGGTRKKDAWVCAQDIVNSNLKAPSTAEYCSYPSADITWNGGSDYTVSGYVDAENGFGSMVRTYFTVTLTLTAKGYKNGYVTFN